MKIGAPEDVVSLLNLVLAPVVMLTVCGMLLNSLWARFHTISGRLLALTNEQTTLTQTQAQGDAGVRERLESIAQEIPNLVQRSRLELAATRTVITAMIVMIGDMFIMAIISFIEARWALWLAVLLFLVALGMLCRGLLLVVQEIRMSQQGLVVAVQRSQRLAKRLAQPKVVSLPISK